MSGLPGYAWLLEHSHSAQLVRTAVRGSEGESSDPEVSEASGVSGASGQRAVALGASLFRRLSEWCEKQNVVLLVSTTGFHSPPYTDSSDPTEAFMAVAKSIFLDLDVPFSDPSDPEAGESSMYSIPRDGHLNKRGAALVAESVFPFIESQFRGYCRQTTRCAAKISPPPSRQGIPRSSSSSPSSTAAAPFPRWGRAASIPSEAPTRD